MNFMRGIYRLKGDMYAYIFYGQGGKSYGIVSKTPDMVIEEWDEFGNNPDENLNIMTFIRTEENYNRAQNSSGPEIKDRDSFSPGMQLKEDKSKEV
jgi:hypothetical protein